MKINTINPRVGLARYEYWKSGWVEDDKVDEFSYISNMCSSEGVLLSCKLFIPDLVVVGDGGVFRE